MPESLCFIKCTVCRELFRSPIAFATADVFFTSSLIGNTATCKKCGAEVSCNAENMYFTNREGIVYHGASTIPHGHA